jgi:hypothetical protein
VRGVAELARQPIAFGGGERRGTSAAWAGPIMCPREQRSFEGELLVPVEYNETIRGVQIESITETGADADAAQALPAVEGLAVGTPGDWIDEELKEWRKTTVATLRTYATTMLTTSSGAVAVYFAVLKYLGWEQANFGTPVVVLTVAPPVLFLAAAGTFALGLRPSLTYVERSEYAEFRARRVEQMHWRAGIGTLLYVTALLLAVLTFALVLEAAR